jgi:predicted dehydrogenase
MKKMNIGIVGGGMIGEVHIRTLQADGRADISWLATRNTQALKKLSDKYKIRNITTNYKEMLKDESLDAVLVATPPFTHLEIGREIIRSKKNLIMEKPLVSNLNDLKKFEKLVSQNKNLLIMECSARHARLQPKFPYIKKMISNGTIGDIYHIEHRHLTHGLFIEYNPWGTWALKKKLAGGGPFMDWGVYDLSFHLGLFDDKLILKSIKTFTKKNIRTDYKSDIEQHGAALMEFSNGVTYYYERGSGVAAEYPNETVIYGTNGSVKFGFCSWDSNVVELTLKGRNGKLRTMIRKVNMSNHRGDNEVFASHVIDCLMGTAKPELPVSTALNLSLIHI